MLESLLSLKSLFTLPYAQIYENVRILWRVIQSTLNRPPGLYEVLDYDNRLELKDSAGQVALHYKREMVRFLQDNILAYQDQAWGDAEIFADYHCSPGFDVMLLHSLQEKSRSIRSAFIP